MLDYLIYALFYIIGIAVGMFTPEVDAERALSVLQPITLTALVASLLVPFAGFALNERWQRFCVKYGMVPIFGVYTVLVIRSAAGVGALFFIASAAVHFGYWMSGMHSRGYRLRQFELGYARYLPRTARFVAYLNCCGLSHVADQIVQALIRGESLPIDLVRKTVTGSERILLLDMEKEVEEWRDPPRA